MERICCGRVLTDVGHACRQGRTAEADALLVHISTWRELLDVARQNRETSRSEAAAIQARLQLLNGQEISPSVPDAELVAAAGHGSGDRPGGEQEGSRAAAEGFDVLKGMCVGLSSMWIGEEYLRRAGC